MQPLPSENQQGEDSKKAKRRFVSFRNAYHGDTLGAVSVGGVDLFHERYRPMLFPCHKVHYPYCYRCHLGLTHPECGQACLEELEEVLERQQASLAALIIEPLVQGAAGMITAPAGYLKSVGALCSKHEILLITDEVAVGFGRTGTLFACEQEGVRPDLMAVAKGITGATFPWHCNPGHREDLRGVPGRGPFSGADTLNDHIVNVPLPAGTTGRPYREAFSARILPRLKAFRPQMLFCSAGFDGHREDEMAQFGLVEADHAWITEQVMDVAARHAKGRIVSVLEGGYDLSSLGRSVAAHIKTLATL